MKALRQLTFRVATAALMAGLAGTMAPAQDAATDYGIRWGVSMDVSTLDPVYATNNWEVISTYNMYDPLLWPDTAKGVAPWVAESWEISRDGKTYTFKIRPGLKFHDGSELTAEDVAFSMQRMLTLNGPTAAYFPMIKASGVSYEGDTVTFTLEEANSTFLKLLVLFRIVNKDLVMANLADGTHGEMKDYGAAFVRANDAGSGPYQLQSYRPGEAVRVNLFKDYALSPLAAATPAYFEFQITPEIATIVTKLRAGEVDVGDLTVPSQVQRQIEKEPHMMRREDVTVSPWYIVMNNSKPPMDDIWVRRAVATSFDINTAVQHILGGGGPLAGPVPAAMIPGCEGIATYPFDIEKAKELLAKSKYSADELSKMSLEIASVAGSERFNNVSMLFAANLSRIGVPTKVVPVRWADIVQAQTKRDTAYDFVLYIDVARVSAPTMFLNNYTPRGWGAAFPPGGMYYENPEVTALVDKGLASTDLAVQNASYCEASKLIAEDSPSIFSHTDFRQIPHWDYIKGFPSNEGALFYDIRFDRWALDLESAQLKSNQK